MLLRSSSTPMLECLLASHSHADSVVDSRHEASTCGDAAIAKSISLSNSSLTTGVGPQPCLHGISRCDSGAPPLQVVHGKDPGSSPHPTLSRVRKVQSESDLSTLGGSMSSARVAANTLVSDDHIADVEEYDTSLFHFSGRKSASGLPLSRRRSLGSLPMDLPSVFFHGGSSSILEEVEPYSYSSTSSEVDATESMTRVFDKLALPVAGEVADSKHKVGTFQLNNVHHDDDGDEGPLPQSSHDAAALPRLTNEGAAFLTSPDAMVDNSDMQGPEQTCSAPVSRTYSGSGYVRGGGSLTLVKEACSPALGSRSGDDKVDVAFGGGDGGRGARPPALGGRGGGGGTDGYGHGVDMTELHYKNMLKQNPGHPLLLRNYAQFLADVKRDHGKAEEYYQRAILANPTDGELLGQYAKMIWEVQHDRERAATYFERAVQAAPDNSYTMAAYASFLWSLEEEEEEEALEGSTSKVPTVLSLVPVGLA